jgi:hypothetical protein
MEKWMKVTKSMLRVCAQTALRRRGFEVSIAGGRGIVRGARLIARKGQTRLKIAVRTSLDREIGLTRNEHGEWRTVPKMDEVIVVVRSSEDDAVAEVLAFDPGEVVEAFDAVVKESRDSVQAFKAPVFVPVDARRTKEEGLVVLKEKARWKELVSIQQISRGGSSDPKGADNFIERVKRDFAELVGVDVSKVSVEIRIAA